MADVKVEKQSQQQSPQRGEQQGRSLSRRQDFFPSDLFSMHPFSIMRRLSDEMDRAFASTFGLSRSMGEAGMWSPPIEVTERDNHLVVRAELPGLDKDDVKVECTNEGLVIEGEKRQEHKEEHGGIYRSERSYGRFYRMVPLPEGADLDKAKAEFKNGILEVSVPVPEQGKRNRQIPINT